jgi:predicted MPP superfamily phosphohydrolase
MTKTNHIIEFTNSNLEVVSDNKEKRIFLQIESTVLKEDNQWRFYDGANSFLIKITDFNFIQKIKDGREHFKKGDILVVDLRRTQTIVKKVLKTDYSIVLVHEHRINF